jgi:hypothetical protein
MVAMKIADAIVRRRGRIVVPGADVHRPSRGNLWLADEQLGVYLANRRLVGPRAVLSMGSGNRTPTT